MRNTSEPQSNLPALEFCSVDRATRILNCEATDIYHWHNMGYIDLCFEISDLKLEIIVDCFNFETTPENENDHRLDLQASGFAKRVKKDIENGKIAKGWSINEEYFRISDLELTALARDSQIHGKKHISSFVGTARLSGLVTPIHRNKISCRNNDTVLLAGNGLGPISDKESNIYYSFYCPDGSYATEININEMVILRRDIEALMEGFNKIKANRNNARLKPSEIEEVKAKHGLTYHNEHLYKIIPTENEDEGFDFETAKLLIALILKTLRKSDVKKWTQGTLSSEIEELEIKGLKKTRINKIFALCNNQYGE